MDSLSDNLLLSHLTSVFSWTFSPITSPGHPVPVFSWTLSHTSANQVIPAFSTMLFSQQNTPLRRLLCVARWGARGESGLRNCERPPLASFFKLSNYLTCPRAVPLFYNESLFIPQIMPVFCAFPQEYLTFDQSVSFFECTDLCHFLIGQRIFCDAFQVAYIVMY